MKITTSKKKIVLATLLTSGLTLAVSQSALSQPAHSASSDNKGTQMMSHGRNQMDPAMLKLHEKFLNETVVIRKEMVQKNAVMRALLDADISDATTVSQVAGEFFDLREKIRVKANEIGMPMMGMGMGYGRRYAMSGNERSSLKYKAKMATLREKPVNKETVAIPSSASLFREGPNTDGHSFSSGCIDDNDYL